ncbi:MAG: cupin domain-containing protein [Alphaproteobacteria bacterium]|nr:cupin domain-containing protein [Alphaproteobacteria bacterium]
MSPEVTRRNFSQDALTAALAGLAVSASGTAALAETSAAGPPSARRPVIKQALPGEPERELILVEVSYPPGGASAPHMHANGVMAFVLTGAITSRIGDGPEQTFRAGEAWYEPPGSIHRVSRNASATETASLLAIFLAPKGASPDALTKPL